MIFDAIAAEPEMLGLVDRLTSARRLELLAATTSIDQIAATPDPAHRKALQRVRVLVVAPAVDGPAGRACVAALQSADGVDLDDALIAAAAVVQGVPLVTEDRDLRLAIASQLPRAPLWRWEADLRPRILGLAAVLEGEGQQWERRAPRPRR
jgi:predicted nucleic acid-binding protein